jgi:hypothetical protein
MPTSRKGMNFKEFASTLRYPPLEFEQKGGDPLQTPAADFLKQFAVGTINSIMDDLKENSLEAEQNRYNKKVFKTYKEKIKEDEELKNPVNKLAKAALVDKGKLNGGDPLATAISNIIDSFTDNITLDSIKAIGPDASVEEKAIRKDNLKLAREELLASIGVNTLTLMTSIGLSALARITPIEQLTQFNTQEYLKFLDPVFLLEKLLASIKNKTFQEAADGFKLVGRFVNSVLTSSQFESKMQQVFLDRLAEQQDLPPQLRGITRFDEVTALVNPDSFDVAPPDPVTFVNLSTVSLDLLQNGKLGLDLELVSRDVNGNVLGEVSLNSLSEDLTGLVSGAQDDLQSLFDSLEACSLPNPEMFNKYRKLGLAISQFFRKGKKKPLALPKKPEKPKLPVLDKHKLLEEIPAVAAAAAFYTATSLLFKAIISALEKLVPDLSCASIAAMIPDPTEVFGPKNQNSPMSPEQLAQTIAENMRLKNPSAIEQVDVEAISGLLAEIATSIGLVNGVDINTLNQFMSLTMSVLTEREYCELLGGSPTGETILIIQNIIDYRFPQAGISRSGDDIIRFFTSLSTLLDPGCDRILSTVDIPVNTVFCSTPEYYQLYNDLRIQLLKERGLQDRDIEVQISKVCDINARQAQQFLNILNSDDPLDSMIPVIETGAPNCGPDNSIELVNEIVARELKRSYTNIFEPLKDILDESMIGSRGFLTRILSSKNGIAYPLYINLLESIEEAVSKNELIEEINEIPDSDIVQSEILNDMEPKTIASWMALNLEEFCNLSHTGRMASTPLNIQAGSFNNPDAVITDADTAQEVASEYRLTDNDKQRLRYLINLTDNDVVLRTPEEILNYDDLFKKLGNIKFGVRGLSYSGVYDPVQSTIGSLNIEGMRQINNYSNSNANNKMMTSKMLSILSTALVAPHLLPSVIAENGIAASDLTKKELKQLKVIPSVEKNISFKDVDYRVKSYSFFMLPAIVPDAPAGTIRTQIFDYFPVNLSTVSQKISPLKKDSSGDYLKRKKDQQEKDEIQTDNQGVFDSNRKFYDINTLTKNPDDYLISLTGSNISTPLLTETLNDFDVQGSTQSLIFAEMVLKAMQDNLGFTPDSRAYTNYLKKELYNYVFNSFLDGMMKIPAYNTKNLSFGITQEKVNRLDYTHINTVTGELDPVEDPTQFGGSPQDPSYYIYTKLNDDWKGLYNLYVRERNDEVSPARTPIPDFQALTSESAELYQKLKEEYRTATDYSNQIPFDLITTKASLVSMNGLLEMMIKVFVFEHYYKGFSFLNTVEITDNVFDNVYFQFLAKRFKEYAITAGPRIGIRRRKDKKFYHMLMEIYVMILLKKKEGRIGQLTNSENTFLSKIIRKSNIWKVGIPKSNLTPEESVYLNAYDKIALHEVPGYPLGVVANAIGSSENSLAPANAMIAQAKKQREEQIKIRNTYWSLIMEDCEPLFEELLKIKLREEMQKVSKQLSILNPNLIKENSILYMPINGGPIVQNYEVPIENDTTLKMRNIYDYHPALLYSAGDLLVTDNAYGAFFSLREEGNDRNFNGFLFSKLYSKPGNINAVIKCEPKEPVYKYGINDPISNADMKNYILNAIGPDSNALLFGGGRAITSNGLSATTINSIELNKRDIIVNKFLLNPRHTKAGIDSDFNFNFRLLDDGDVYAKLQKSIIDTISDQGVSQTYYSDFYSGEEIKYNSVKRYKVFNNERSKISPLGSNGFVVGGYGSSDMPKVLSQTPIPFVLEQYIYLSEIGDYFQGTAADRANYQDLGTGIDWVQEVRRKLETVLYLRSGNASDVMETFDSSAGIPTTEGIFRGPVSLSTLIYWLGSQNFFLSLDFSLDSVIGGQNNKLLDMPLKWFFEPGTLKYGVRMLLSQPNSNLSFDEGIYTYFDSLGVEEQIKFEKAFSKENGYAIPLFKAEEAVEWTFRDLKAIYNEYSSQSEGPGQERNSWIDHSKLTRPINLRLFSTIACSEEYKRMFDFCIPLRYFASLSAIYTTKAFVNSIGSSADWSGVKKTSQKLFPRDERHVLLPFYESVRKVYYYSYNSFDPTYDGADAEFVNPNSEAEAAARVSRPITRPGRDGLVMVDEIAGSLDSLNVLDPLKQEQVGDLQQYINTSYSTVLVADPTNACGSVKKSEDCN